MLGAGCCSGWRWASNGCTPGACPAVARLVDRPPGLPDFCCCPVTGVGFRIGGVSCFGEWASRGVGLVTGWRAVSLVPDFVVLAAGSCFRLPAIRRWADHAPFRGLWRFFAR